MSKHLRAPLKLQDIKAILNRGIRGMTPNSLAFLMASQIPAVPTDMDQRRIPFSNISPQLRDQRQMSLANPRQYNPFSVFGAQGLILQGKDKSF